MSQSNNSLLCNNKNYLLQSLLQNFLKRLNVKFIYANESLRMNSLNSRSFMNVKFKKIRSRLTVFVFKVVCNSKSF